MRRRGLAPRTIAQCRAALGNAFQQALAFGMMASNLVCSVKRLKIERPTLSVRQSRGDRMGRRRTADPVVPARGRDIAADLGRVTEDRQAVFDRALLRLLVHRISLS